MTRIKSTEEVKYGDRVYYKRQGQYGSYEAEVVSVGKRIRIRVYSWCGTPVAKEYFANVKPRAIAKLPA